MTVSGCMHAYQTSFMYNVSSSYFGVASLTVALTVGCIFPPSFGLLGGMAWSGMEGVVWPALVPWYMVHDEQLQVASSGNQFSKIWPHLNLYIALLPASR